MTHLIKKDNVESLVDDDPLLIGATTLNLPTDDGALFPAVGDFMGTFWDDLTYPDPTDDPDMEKVRCTARTADAITIARGQGGTDAKEHPQGTRFAMLHCEEHFNELADQDLKSTDDVDFGTVRASGDVEVDEDNRVILNADDDGDSYWVGNADDSVSLFVKGVEVYKYTP